MILPYYPSSMLTNIQEMVRRLNTHRLLSLVVIAPINELDSVLFPRNTQSRNMLNFSITLSVRIKDFLLENDHQAPRSKFRLASTRLPDETVHHLAPATNILHVIRLYL
uniref:Uncharacterized protein n=1 Tax=Spongospora subterranea TaxID=70186 RepID=A0A0H5R229_9EUKA|eukprot:CRZ01884.1 hypothetical protein [Spongospora subterranea]